MKTWSVRSAKARFSEFLDACLSEGPQLVTRRGSEAAVLVPMHIWKKLQSSGRPTLKELLLTEEGKGDLMLPPRGTARRRKPGELA